MAQQQEFHPGLSLAGAVDLESLKQSGEGGAGQAGGAPAAGGYVIDTTENTFQAMVQTSATFPILLLLWIPTDDRLFPMARTLGDAVNKLKADSAVPHRHRKLPIDRAGVPGAGRTGAVRADRWPPDADSSGAAGR